MIGLFKMNGRNTPKVAERLLQYGLEYIPEAHCYLKYNGFILDYTKAHSKPSDFVHDLIMETEIEPDQITRFKVDYHRQYLMEWLQMNKGLPFSIDEIWAIREACIGDLSK
jgi:N-acetylmuramoyl-L-alanine amidase CwlA